MTIASNDDEQPQDQELGKDDHKLSKNNNVVISHLNISLRGPRTSSLDDIWPYKVTTNPLTQKNESEDEAAETEIEDQREKSS